MALLIGTTIRPQGDQPDVRVHPLGRNGQACGHQGDQCREALLHVHHRRGPRGNWCPRQYILSQFGPLSNSNNCASLVRGYVAVGTAMPVARRSFPKPEYHRAGHSAVASSRTQRGYTTVVHTKLNKSSEPQAATCKPSLGLPVNPQVMLRVQLGTIGTSLAQTGSPISQTGNQSMLDWFPFSSSWSRLAIL